MILDAAEQIFYNNLNNEYHQRCTMNGTESTSLRSQRDNYGSNDEVTSPLAANTASLGGVVVGNGNNLNASSNLSYNTGGGHVTSSSLARSQSASSSSVGSPTTDNVTPPALHASATMGGSAVFGSQMASLSHYNNQMNAVAALSAGFRNAPVIASNNGRRYACKLCPSMFESKAELQIHTQVHMREAKPYKCSHCPKSFANSSYLSQHMRIHLGIKPFGPCQYCQRKFTQLSHLQQHLRTHTGDKPYSCRFVGCEKSFSQLSNLQSHSRCHQTDKPYKCNSCYKCFTDEQALLEHIPKHKESKHLKVHICGFCGKSYTQATYLAKHMTKHADRKPIKTMCSMVDDHVWSSREGSVCAMHGIADSCGDMTPPNALTFNVNSFQAHNHIMQSQNCAYASNMASMAGMSAADPSAFTRLTGLAPLGGRFASSTRNPYAALAHNPHAGGYGTSYNSSLIGLNAIKNYGQSIADHQAAANAEHFNMLLKRDPRETAY